MSDEQNQTAEKPAIIDLGLEPLQWMYAMGLDVKGSVMRDWQRTFTTKTSEKIDLIIASLAIASLDFHNGVKAKKAHNYKYMELSQLLEIVREPLAKNGIIVYQAHELLSRKSGPSVVTETTLYHSSGQFLTSYIELPVNFEPNMKLERSQSIGITASYGRRYGLQAALGIAAEEDTDGIPVKKKDEEQPTENPQGGMNA